MAEITDKAALLTKRSDRIIAFIEKLRIPSGADAGRPFKLREWQKRIIRRVYDGVDEAGLRLVRRVILTMAKKNAKTTLIAALVLVHLVGPEALPSQEIYSAANDRAQAAIVYRAAETMVKMSPDLSRLVKCVPSQKRLVCHHFGSFYQALSADAKTKQGMSPSVFIYDELGTSTKSDLYDALDTAQGAWKEPLSFVISTQARDPKSLMSQLVDDARRVLKGEVNDPTLAAFIFEVPKDANPFDEALWKLANPALGDFLSLQDMRNDAEKARRLPSRMSVFRNLRLNQQVDGVDQLIGREDWVACGTAIDLEKLRGRACYGGLDLSAKRDLTSATFVFEPLGDDPLMPVHSENWTPGDDIADRALRDKAEYPLWRDQGFLHAPPGRTIDYRHIARRLGELHGMFDIRGLAFDRWRIDDLLRALDDEGIPAYVEKRNAEGELDPECIVDGGIPLIKFGQGFKDMGPAVDQVEEDVVNHRFAHGMNPVLTFCASNAVAVADPTGARKLDKTKARNRIDAFVALTMANCIRWRAAGVPETGSIYDEPGLVEKLMGSIDDGRRQRVPAS